LGLLGSQHLGIETRETSGKYSSQVQNGWLHKVSGLLGATRVYDKEREKIEWARQGSWRRRRRIPPETDRVAKTQPVLTKSGLFISPFKPLHLAVSVYSAANFIFRYGIA